MGDSIQGVVVAAITPRRAGSASIDLAAALDFTGFLSSHPISGIALMGSTGEFPHFETEERTRLTGMVAKRSAVPVIASVGHSTFDGTVRLAQEALDHGAAAVLVPPPYYFRYDSADLKEFYLRLADQVSGSMYLYNIPLFSSELPAAAACDLLATGRFAGIKDSSGRWDDFVAIQTVCVERGLKFLCGSDTMYSRARPAGAAGVVSGCGSAVPELMCAIERAVTAGHQDRLAVLDAHLADFVRWLFCFPLPLAIREGVALRGLKTGPHCMPLPPERQRKLEEFRAWFSAWLPRMQKDCRDA